MQACRELDASKEFVDVLQYILSIGNYLNAGTKHGGAYGFKLVTLPKVYFSIVLTFVFLVNTHEQ